MEVPEVTDHFGNEWLPAIFSHVLVLYGAMLANASASEEAGLASIQLDQSNNMVLRQPFEGRNFNADHTGSEAVRSTQVKV